MMLSDAAWKTQQSEAVNGTDWDSAQSVYEARTSKDKEHADR